jgi:hypothetical protein
MEKLLSTRKAAASLFNASVLFSNDLVCRCDRLCVPVPAWLFIPAEASFAEVAVCGHSLERGTPAT